MYTIGQLSKFSQLSRGTLIYYDSIGLLKPTERTETNYRRYSEADVERLREICRYRETGMPLADIQEILDIREKPADSLLEKRLDDLNQEIKKLHIQRQIIALMLKREKQTHSKQGEAFAKALETLGLSDLELAKLHVEFEKESPEEHQAFLEFIGFPAEEIAEIRAYSRKTM